MKLKQILTLFILSFCTLGAFAQHANHPHSLRVAAGVQDSYGPYKGDPFPLGIWNDENLDLSFQLQYMKWFNDFLDAGIGVTATDNKNLYDKKFSYVNNAQYIDEGSTIDVDLTARYKFYNGRDFNIDALIKPYVYTGISGTNMSELDTRLNVDDGFGANVPLGIGFKLGRNESFNIDLDGAYRFGLFDKIPGRWDYKAGFSFNFGSPKSKSNTEEEYVPIAPPPPAPPPAPKDSDEDGIIDSKDACPNEAGIARLNGCPEKDTDEDGIADDIDNCPTVPGVISNDGCPAIVDTDGDGVPDDEDSCPTVAGSSTNSGCPVVVDSDGDGVPDNEDNCPNVAGSTSNAGCPVQNTTSVGDEILSRVDDIAENIFFDLNSATLKSQSKLKLNELITILNQYPNQRLYIEGYTDSSGSASYNKTLSERRAAAVRDYLVSKGIPSSRISSAGYGEERPIADNSTPEGREKNRRVELHLRR